LFGGHRNEHTSYTINGSGNTSGSGDTGSSFADFNEACCEVERASND
jgi:hypothetical protein